jgi:HEPN domain-containing protein
VPVGIHAVPRNFGIKIRMGNRAEDWLEQAKRDLLHAQGDLASGFYEWGCFSAQQAAEKVLKAVYQRLGAEAWGHSVTALLDHLPSDLTPPAELFDQAKMLDRYYIPTRYPNSFAQGAPKDYFTKRDAEEAINCARNIIAFCERYISHA